LIKQIIGDPQEPYLVDIFEDIQRKSIHQAMLVRTGVALFLAAWVLSHSASYADFFYYLALISVFIGGGLGYFMLSTTHYYQQWHAYLLVTIDAVLLSLLLLYRPYGDGPVDVNLNGQAFLYYFALLSVSALSSSPRLVLWTMLANLLSWNLGVWLFLKAPYVVTLSGLPSDIGYLFETNTSYIQVWLQQTVLMLTVGGVLAVALWQLRTVMARQIVSEREFYDILVAERTARYSEEGAVTYTNPLTGLGTRAAFDRDSAQFTKVFAEGRLSDLTIAFIDLEGNQAIKDSRGDTEFERMLCSFAEAARVQFRSSDMLYHFSDDQFALLAPGATLSNAERLQNLLHNIIHYVKAQGFPEIEAKMGLSTLHEVQAEGKDD